jgi:phage/plasmid-like protein (TIGR03299 family)
MAHNLNYNESTKKFSFYSRKEIPWHGLGQFIGEATDAYNALELAQLNYEVKTGPIWASFIPSGCTCKFNPDTNLFEFRDNRNVVVGTSTKRSDVIPNLRSIYRDDTKDLFGTVSDRYEVVQNAETLDMIFEMFKNNELTDKKDITIETAGALKKGETIFVTARMPSYVIDTKSGKDLVDKYIVITTSHNKSNQLTALITDVRVVCNNTLSAAMNTNRKITLRHTKNIRERFSEFAALLGLSRKYSLELKYELEALNAIDITSDNMREYIYDLIIPSGKREIVRGVSNLGKIDNDVISAKLKNKVADVINYIDKGPGQDIARGSAYWVYNGVTSYYSNGVDYKDKENRFAEIMGGNAEANIANAYDKLLQYVN